MKFDVAHHLAATSREVANRQFEGKPARVVVITRSYDTSVEDLWDAVTNPERIPRWFLPVTGDLRLGGRYQLQGNAGGTITACEPPRRLFVTWEFGGQVSWVEIRLSEAEDGARLELEHIAHPSDHWTQYGPGAVGIGWELGLMGLFEHLATGAAVDPKAFGAWSASAEGKAFITGSGEAWGEAAVVAGDEAEAARASARRTTAFYTGQPAD